MQPPLASASGVRFAHALSASGALVDVRTLTDATRHSGAPYRCPECDDEMIPKLGPLRASHFAHKEGLCSYESYLHKLAKLTFAETFETCRRLNLPLLLVHEFKQKCNALPLLDPCLVTFPEPLNLAQHFDTVHVEKGVGGFVADVLLASTKHDGVLLVEFAVSHACSAEKLRSGLRIAEWKISNEKDIDTIRAARLDPKRVTCHNFRDERPPSPACERNCINKGERLTVCTVDRDGRAALQTMSRVEAQLALESAQTGALRHAHVSDQKRPLNPHERNARTLYALRHAERRHGPLPSISSCYACALVQIEPGDQPRCPVLERTVEQDIAVLCNRFEFSPERLRVAGRLV